MTVVPRTVTRSDRVLIVLAVALVAAAALVAHHGGVASFVVSLVAVAVLAALVSRCVDHLADRLGAGATGVLQSALGNLPELFIALFALRAGLPNVVNAAIIGSILANLLLLLGLSFTVGGTRHGVLRFSAGRARTITALMLLAVAGMLVPSLAEFVHSPAAHHELSLSRVTAVVLLVVFALSVPTSLRRRDHESPAPGEAPEQADGNVARWPLWLAISLLAASSVLAAYVSDLFVNALQPAMATLHISQSFAGLVIVAIAGNAVEHTVGIKLAWQNQADHALSVILNSPLQIALVLAPALVLLAPLVGNTPFTMVFSPLLVSTVAIGTVAVAFIIYDGMSDRLEGVAMIGLYILIATAFWWG